MLVLLPALRLLDDRVRRRADADPTVGLARGAVFYGELQITAYACRAPVPVVA